MTHPASRVRTLSGRRRPQRSWGGDGRARARARSATAAPGTPNGRHLGASRSGQTPACAEEQAPRNRAAHTRSGRQPGAQGRLLLLDKGAVLAHRLARLLAAESDDEHKGTRRVLFLAQRSTLAGCLRPVDRARGPGSPSQPEQTGPGARRGCLVGRRVRVERDLQAFASVPGAGLAPSKRGGTSCFVSLSASLFWRAPASWLPKAPRPGNASRSPWNPPRLARR